MSQAGSSAACAKAAGFVRALREAGFDFFTGVPCSLVAPVISELEPHGWVAETREDAALGLAAGAWLAGGQPVVLMQSSGLALSLNALASLHTIYALPCLLLVTWRGYQGKDAPEHLVLGRALPALLDACEIPWRTLAAPRFVEDLRWALDAMAERPGPVALAVTPEVFA